ncbi:hypothetical protein HK096_008676, partial [Nowakowskiella sp. JEL0078]
MEKSALSDSVANLFVLKQEVALSNLTRQKLSCFESACLEFLYDSNTNLSGY